MRVVRTRRRRGPQECAEPPGYDETRRDDLFNKQQDVNDELCLASNTTERFAANAAIKQQKLMLLFIRFFINLMI